MEKTKYFLWALVGIISIWSLVSMSGGSSDGMGGNIKERQVLSDVSSAVTTIECGYSEMSSMGFTATQGAKNYIDLIRSTREEGEELLRQAGKVPQEPIKHVLGKPDAPWEIVLQPNNEEGRITVLGFGSDLSAPLLKKEVLCK
jgi:hypothetical protein